MNNPQPPARRRNWTHHLVNLLVSLVVIGIAAAAFVLSYPGVHSVALLGGVSGQLARYYPGLFDAVLVIACVAAVLLREGRWWTRLWAWTVIVAVLVGIGAADMLHAMGYTLRHRVTEGVVAAAPVAAILLAFSLLLTLLRRSGVHEQRPAERLAEAEPLDRATVPTVPVPTMALPAAPVTAAPVTEVPPPPVPAPPAPAPSGAMPPAPMPSAPAPTGPAPLGAVPPAPMPPVSLPPVPPPVPEARRDDMGEPDASGEVPAAAVAVPPGDVVPPPTEAPTAPVPTGQVPTVPVPAVPAPADQAPAGAVPVEAVPVEAVPVAEAQAAPDMQAAPKALAAREAQAAPAPVSEPTVQPKPGRGTVAIRYAGSSVPGMAGNQAATQHTAEAATEAAAQRAPQPAPPAAGARGKDYWDTDETDQLAGLVYSVRADSADADDEAGDLVERDNHDTRGQEDQGGPGGARRVVPVELDDDAPPFVTAPFAAVPRLNRVRSTPAPPAEEED